MNDIHVFGFCELFLTFLKVESTFEMGIPCFLSILSLGNGKPTYCSGNSSLCNIYQRRIEITVHFMGLHANYYLSQNERLLIF